MGVAFEDKFVFCKDERNEIAAPFFRVIQTITTLSLLKVFEDPPVYD